MRQFKAALIVPKGSKYGKNPFLKSFLERNDIVSNFYGAWETPNLSLLTIAGLFRIPPLCDLLMRIMAKRFPFTRRLTWWRSRE